MNRQPAVASLNGGVGLLERAVNYTLGSLRLVTPARYRLPTPCQGWNVLELLRHMDDSLLALREAADLGEVGLDAPADPAGDPVTVLRDRACALLGAWANAERGLVSVAGMPLTAGIVAGTGAIEVAVHGWDLARACGAERPIPPALAEEMLALSPFFVTDADRPGRFGAPIPLPRCAEPGDRLLAFLGREPSTVD